MLFVPACDWLHVKSDREAALEREIAALKTKLAAIDSASKEAETAVDECLANAEYAYWDTVKLNGHEVKKGGKGTGVWRARSHVWAQAAQNKANAIAECKLTGR